MDIVMVPVAAIHLGTRQRPVDATKVQELARSVQQVGLLQAIGIVPDTSQPPACYRLVFGAHRFRAVQRLEQRDIAASILPPDLDDDEYVLIELQENLTRNDLTGAQRKAFAAEVGRILPTLTHLAHSPNGQVGWMTQMGNTTGIPHSTLSRWWLAFCQEQGITVAPRHALASQREHFFVWLEAHRQAEEAEKARRAEESVAAQRDLCLRELAEELREVVETYGWQMVYERVVLPLLEMHEAL
jgi:hypothetical protein